MEEVIFYIDLCLLHGIVRLDGNGRCEKCAAETVQIGVTNSDLDKISHTSLPKTCGDFVARLDHEAQGKLLMALVEDRRIDADALMKVWIKITRELGPYWTDPDVNVREQIRTLAEGIVDELESS
jgi:hypothetical protein